MTTLNPRIFHSYDIRGVYGDDFDGAFTQQLGSRIASYLNAGVFVVGRDGRGSSEELAQAVITGAKEVGAQVIDIGEVSSPQFYWAVRELGAVGGIMVTASHNPGAYNGFKVIGHGGEIIGGHHLRQIYDSHRHVQKSGGVVDQRDIIPDYATAVIAASGGKGHELSLSLDAPLAVRRALALMAPVAPDHGLAARFDADGDRISFFEQGRPIAADWIFLLLAEHLALEPLVFDLRFSRAVREFLDTKKTLYTVSRVGRLEMVQQMHRSQAALGAETSGHFYWKQFGGMECPELVLLHVARIMEYESKGLGELIAPYVKYQKSDEISIPVRDSKSASVAIDRVAWYFGEGKSSRIDGLTVEYPDWWFNLRPSNTEPVLRLVVEADSKELLDSKISEIMVTLRR